MINSKILILNNFKFFPLCDKHDVVAMPKKDFNYNFEENYQ